jgi:aerobic-type carbon monoxide dehydrogenase small subunit (CoxS/CutS family)
MWIAVLGRAKSVIPFRAAGLRKRRGNWSDLFSAVVTSHAKEETREEPMAGKIKLRVNERVHEVDAAPDTPLLYVLADDLRLQGPRFGCGLAQCGSCSVLVNGDEIRSCVTPVSAVEGKAVTTLEGLPAWYAKRHKLAKAPALHPVQQAMIDEQAVQCGYCFNGMIVQAAELLSKNPQPTEAEIRTAMNGHLCRCGSYPRVIKAIQRASQVMAAMLDDGAAEKEIAREIGAAEVAR